MAQCDYLILGATTASQVLASRLHEYDSDVSITLVDLDTQPAWPSPSSSESQGSSRRPSWASPMARSFGARFANSPLLLPTSSSTSSPTWRRSGAEDYNRWAKLVNDSQWSYEGLQPCFQRVEAEFEQHATISPDSPTTPMRAHISELVHRIVLADTQASRSRSVGGDEAAAPLYTESYSDQAVPVSSAYSLNGVKIIPGAVRGIIFRHRAARGVELMDGRLLIARREVIIAAGAVQTAHLLLLSGIGPRDEIAELSIEPRVNVPHVGYNMHEQCAFVQSFTVTDHVRDAEQSDEFEYGLGSPIGLMITATPPQETLRRAIRNDGESEEENADSLLKPTRGQLRICSLYSPQARSESQQTTQPSVAVVTVNMLPTSRGSVRLSDNNPSTPPLVTPSCYTTEADRAVLRSGIRLASRAFESPVALRSFQPSRNVMGLHSLDKTSSDEEVDSWVEYTGLRSISTAGTAAMGKVVDTKLKVYGTERLRVVDESVLPCPIAADYRALACVLAEQGAALITMAWSGRDECSPI